jgi:hypothetical protein
MRKFRLQWKENFEVGSRMECRELNNENQPVVLCVTKCGSADVDKFLLPYMLVFLLVVY